MNCRLFLHRSKHHFIVFFCEVFEASSSMWIDVRRYKVVYGVLLIRASGEGTQVTHTVDAVPPSWY